jgi:hypothetical protein
LNEILNWISKYKTNEAPPTLKQTLTFYLKSNNDTTKIVKSDFALPADFKPFEENYQTAVEAVDRCVLELLYKSGIREKSDDATGIREELRMAINNDFQTATMDNIENSWWDTQIPTVDELIQSKMLFTSDDLTPSQLIEGIEHMKENINEMQFHRWKESPISLSLAEYGTNMDGFLVIPYNFKIDEFLNFLDENNEKVKEKRIVSIENQATEIIDLVDKIEKIAAKITYSKEIPSEILVDCLKRVLALDKQLIYFVIDIGSKPNSYRLSNVGVMTIPFDFKKEDFIAFLRSFGDDKIAKVRAYHQAFQKIARESLKLGNEILDIVKMKALDLTTKSTAHPYDKLLFLEYFKEHALHMTRYDWSEWTFVLHDGVNVDIEETFVFLPKRFDLMQMVEQVVSHQKGGTNATKDMIEGDEDDDDEDGKKLDQGEFNATMGQIYRDLPGLLETAGETKESDFDDLDEDELEDLKYMTQDEQAMINNERSR